MGAQQEPNPKEVQPQKQTPIRSIQEANWWEEEVMQGAPKSFLPEHQVNKLSQIVASVIREPVTPDQISWALQLVTPHEDDQENSDSEASDEEAKEEEEEGTVESIEIGKKSQTLWENFEPIEQSRDKTNLLPQKRTPQQGKQGWTHLRYFNLEDPPWSTPHNLDQDKIHQRRYWSNQERSHPRQL